MGVSSSPVARSSLTSSRRRATRASARSWASASRSGRARREPVALTEQRSAGLDVARVRKDFPILERTVGGKPLVYLDSAATSQKPNQVIDAEADFYRQHNANAHRGIYLLAEETTELYEQARARLARFVGATDPETIVFTRGTTESTNLVAYAWGRKVLREGDEILLSEM